ncbi:MAG: carboxypeptidase regulatory-like domain-containing protein [Deltaproteobacteria bacterium]|nr:carboxypeptidase regulatory-like domain-containing protein [Deltaproteobacteria bacterium]
MGSRTVVVGCLALICVSLGACGGGGPSTCVPGKVESCPCDRGARGTQACLADGTWGPCEGCAEADAVVIDTSGVDAAAGGPPFAEGAPDPGGGDTPWVLPDASVDSFSVVEIVSPDSTPSASCDPCGYGALKGLVCAPDLKTVVPNALVTIDVIDCDGKAKQFQTATDKDGGYVFPQVPCGNHQVTATAGSFQTSFPITIQTGQVTDVTGVNLRCFDSQQVKVAVFWGQWDRLQDLLTALGIQYTFFNFETEFFSDTPPKDIEAFQVLSDPVELARFDILFFDCGSAAIKWVSGYPDIRTNLRNYVLFGGSVYASDLAWEYVEGAFPDAIRFHGSNELPSTGMDPNGPQVVKDHQNTVANVLDDVLAAYLGKKVLPVHYGSGPLILVDSAGEGTTTHVSGKVLVKNPKYGQFLQPEYVESAESPFVLSFSPGPGAGRVVYTTFHNDEQADALILKILHYLVFLL